MMSGNAAKPQQLVQKPGCVVKPYPGWDIRILDEEGLPTKTGDPGLIVSRLPNPPSFMTTLWKNDQAFYEKYFKQIPGYYVTGDNGYFDEKYGY